MSLLTASVVKKYVFGWNFLYPSEKNVTGLSSKGVKTKFGKQIGKLVIKEDKSLHFFTN